MESWETSQSQEVIECYICQKPVSFFCRRCGLNLCDSCVPKHLRVKSKTGHDVVNYMTMDDGETYFCESHPKRECSAYCKACDGPICILCVSIKHKSHEISDLSDKKDRMKGISRGNIGLQSFRHEIEALFIDTTKKLFPFFLIIILAFNICFVYQNIFEKGTENVKAQGGECSNLFAIDKSVEKLYQEIDDLKKKNDVAFRKQRNEFEDMIGNVKKILLERMDDLKRENNAVLQKHNREFEDMIRNVKISHQDFDDLKKENEEVLQKLRELEGSVKKLERKKLPATVFDRITFKAPSVSSVIDTGFHGGEESYFLCGMAVNVTDDKRVWIGGSNGVTSGELKLFDLQGTLYRTVPIPRGFVSICMYNKHVVFGDFSKKAVVKVSQDGTVVTMFTTGDWGPRGITGSASGDLLVCLVKDNESKVVRYSSTGTVLQEIQYDSQGQSLYQTASYITENVNGDIIVTDYNEGIVTAVDRLGIFRYFYSGKDSPFSPLGVVTDSVGNVLVADFSGKIHMLDRDGQFLTYIIPEGGIEVPHALAMINDGELIIGEFITGLAKTIKFLEEKD